MFSFLFRFVLVARGSSGKRTCPLQFLNLILIWLTSYTS